MSSPSDRSESLVVIDPEGKLNPTYDSLVSKLTSLKEIFQDNLFRFDDAELILVFMLATYMAHCHPNNSKARDNRQIVYHRMVQMGLTEVPGFGVKHYGNIILYFGGMSLI